MANEILLYKNEIAIDQITERCETSIGILQQICCELKTLGCPVDVDKLLETINTHQYTPHETGNNIRLLVIELMEEMPTIGGLSLSKNKLKDIIEIPNLDTILELVKQVPQPISTAKRYIAISGDSVALVENYKGLIIASNSRYATTQKQIDLYNDITQTKDVLNAHIAKFPFYDFLPEMTGLIANNSTKKYEVDGQFVMNNCG